MGVTPVAGENRVREARRKTYNLLLKTKKSLTVKNTRGGSGQLVAIGRIYNKIFIQKKWHPGEAKASEERKDFCHGIQKVKRGYGIQGKKRNRTKSSNYEPRRVCGETCGSKQELPKGWTIDDE